MLSNDFVHIGKDHANLDLPSLSKRDDKAIIFIMNSMIAMAWLLIVAEIVYAHEDSDLQYWERSGDGWLFKPESESVEWMSMYLK